MGSQSNHDVNVSDAGIEVIYRRYIVMVRKRARAILRNEALAEDLAQEVFLKFIHHRQQGGSEREHAAYLYRMTTNLALNLIRDRKRQQQLLWENRSTNARDEGLEDKLTVHRMLSEVNQEEAIIAIHYYVDGMDQNEISGLLDIPRRTVGRRLERFRIKLQSFMTQQKNKGTSDV